MVSSIKSYVRIGVGTRRGRGPLIPQVCHNTSDAEWISKTQQS